MFVTNGQCSTAQLRVHGRIIFRGSLTSSRNPVTSTGRFTASRSRCIKTPSSATASSVVHYPYNDVWTIVGTAEPPVVGVSV